MPKCKICKRKILKWDIDIRTCKCGNLYCGKHAHDHSCAFDHAAAYKEKLVKKLPLIESDKGLIRIWFFYFQGNILENMLGTVCLYY